ncbi:uncharacterized protein LOC121406114 [Lytechinus variegatus]|uniref:uncharacterized protein LOC121406114 n=1 Tax=Lytechinus variegatus TaxID=7654 RepID=UPI001BB1E12C|nr:uncharacterized protein LOC121406114 [Lytechinus variegatus]XP_041453067.1 uncharacterized protein LOC121406114 [Lytechinus variegatus]
MTRIPELGATLSVSKLDTALKERKSLARRGRYTSQRKTERSYDTSCHNKTVDINDGGGDGPLSITDNSASSVIAKTSYEQFRDLKKRRLRNEQSSPEDKERSKNFGISSIATKLSPRLAGSTEKHRIHSIKKADHGSALSPAESETQEDELCTDIVHGSDNEGENDDSDDDDAEDDGVCGADGKADGDGKVIVKSDKTVRPYSDSRISISQSRKDRARKTSLRSGEISHPFHDTTPIPPNHQVSRNSSRASRTYPEELGSPVDGSNGSESNIRQIWRKELGLDARPPRRHFAPKEYITGLAVGYPGQKAAQSQKTVTTTVVPAKRSLSEIQKKRRVLPPIDTKSKSKACPCDPEKPPAPNPVKDINALAADLCRGASLETGNREAEAVYRTFREARKHAFFFDLDSDVGSSRSKYLRPCTAPPNSDDEEGDGDETVREEWNDSSYTRIVRISSPENDGETVITHTVDASKVFDFGGRVIRKTQIDVFLPSEPPDDGIEGEGDEKGSSENEDRENQANGTEENGNGSIEQKRNNIREEGNRTNEKQREQIDNDQNFTSSEEDDEDCEDTGSDESCDSDDDDEDDDDY